jgi:hypothetical protein
MEVRCQIHGVTALFQENKLAVFIKLGVWGRMTQFEEKNIWLLPRVPGTGRNTTEYAFTLSIGQTEAFRNVGTMTQLSIISNSFTLLKINKSYTYTHTHIYIYIYSDNQKTTFSF